MDSRCGQGLVRGVLVILAAWGLLGLPGRAQSSETDATQGGTSAPGPAERGGQHREAGSVEAAGGEMKDKMFLRRASADGLLAIRLGELAQTKSQSDEVKQIGRRMVEDHTKIDEALRPIAETQGVMLPGKLGPREQATYDRLNGLAGDEFDREYLKVMMEGHHAALHGFRMEAANSQDAALREAAETASKTIREHAIAVDALARSKGVAVPMPRWHGAPPEPPPQ